MVVEGQARTEMDPAITKQVQDAYNHKYAWDTQAEPGEFYALTPRVAFGWICDGSGEDGGSLFKSSATRWRFPA